MSDHDSWLTKFSRLRIDTASNAPHKPLLLLVVLDLAERRVSGDSGLSNVWKSDPRLPKSAAERKFARK